MKFEVIEYLDFERAKYYSTKKEGAEISLSESFFTEFKESEFEESLQLIVYWMSKLGERGITKSQLRPEAVNKEGRYDSAIAFPVKTEFIKGDHEIDIFDTNDFQDHLKLRLYGLWLSESVLILLSGCQKTDNDPVKCNNCRPHFLQVNNFSSQLHKQKDKYSIEYKKIVSFENIIFTKK